MRFPININNIVDNVVDHIIDKVDLDKLNFDNLDPDNINLDQIKQALDLDSLTKGVDVQSFVNQFTRDGSGSWNFMPQADGDVSDAFRTFEEICTNAGFQFEQHKVTTDDGYILTVFRIPGLIGEEAPAKPKPPVYMQHGLLDSAFCWVAHHADVAPAFVVARAGYDVWLGNSRGNTFSKGHEFLNPDTDKDEYWDFSWADMGSQDVPAVIRHIQENTDDQMVAYIGHSQGTTQMFYSLAWDAEFHAENTSLFVALGPVTKLPNARADLLRFMVDNYDLVAKSFDLLKINSVMEASDKAGMDVICMALPQVCLLSQKLLFTDNISYDDRDRFAVYMGHMPNGSPVKSLLHFAQNMKEGRFQDWSYQYHPGGRSEERQTDEAPLEDITEVPVAIFPGTADILANVADAEWTRDAIGGAVVHFQPVDAGHATFLVGKDMSYFTEDVMDLLKWYHPLDGDSVIE